MSGKDVTIAETAPLDTCKYCLVGVPDVGLAGTIAVSYIIQEEQMPEVGHLESDKLPPVIVVHNGDPKSPLRIYSKRGVLAVISEIPIESRLIPSVACSVIDWAKSKGVKLLVALSGIAVQNRLEINTPTVYGVGSSDYVKKLIKDAGVEIFEEGFIAGPHAVLMKECLKKNLHGMILLAQSHLRYPDPGAAASLVASINNLIGWKVDTEELVAQEDEIRVKLRALMQRTEEQMQQVKKGQEQEIPPMYIG